MQLTRPYLETWPFLRSTGPCARAASPSAGVIITSSARRPRSRRSGARSAAGCTSGSTPVRACGSRRGAERSPAGQCRRDTNTHLGGHVFPVRSVYAEVVRRSGWNSRNLGSSNGALWTRCGRGPFGGERDSLAEFRGIGAVLAQRMGMALRPGPSCLAIRCRGRGCRRCRRDCDRAGAGNRRTAVLRTAAGLLSTAGLLRPAGLLLRATGTAPVSN